MAAGEPGEAEAPETPEVTEPLAAPESLRRIERLALAWGLAGLAAFLAAGRPRDALALTLATLVSMVSFRGLERLVVRLGPGGARKLGWRGGLLIGLRFALLGGALAAALSLSSGNLLGLIAGFSVLPAALMTEGARLAIRAMSGKDRDGC